MKRAILGTLVFLICGVLAYLTAGLGIDPQPTPTASVTQGEMTLLSRDKMASMSLEKRTLLPHGVPREMLSLVWRTDR
jgi:hypothetical protein